MQATIFIWATLLLVGSVSIVKCYRYSNDDENETPYARRTVDSDSSEERYQSARSAKLARWLGLYEDSEEREEQKRETAGPILVCHTICPPGQISYAQNTCNCPVGKTTTPCETQKDGLCSAAATQNSPSVFSIKFGAGSNKYLTATAASFGFTTDSKQVTSDSGKVDDGYFAFMTTLPGYFSTWLGGAEDTFGGSGTGGNKKYMMVVNVGKKDDKIVQFTINDLTVGFRYEFSAYIANVVKAGSNIIAPDVRFEARTATPDNTLIASAFSQKIPEQASLTFTKYGMSFITPSSSVVFSIMANDNGGNGGDFAIDSILVHACAPINAACSGK